MPKSEIFRADAGKTVARLIKLILDSDGTRSERFRFLHGLRFKEVLIFQRSFPVKKTDKLRVFLSDKMPTAPLLLAVEVCSKAASRLAVRKLSERGS